MKKLNKKGFTLIEMLVVIAIIAILVAIIIPTVTGATTKAKEAADVANLRSAVAEYEIATLDDPDAEFTLPKLNYTDKCTDKGTAGTVTYAATKLTDGNGSADNIYTWDLATIFDTTD